MATGETGLYVHVPYCKALCHYCDFAKTANVTPEISSRYFASLAGELGAWLDDPRIGAFSTVFFGGGTPSLYVDEYEPLMASLAPRLRPGAEVTLEANPDDVTRERLQAWRALGFNRVSLGVQTFEPDGLAFLKRTHGADAAEAAIRHATQAFPTVNADLIYGWPGQDLSAWNRDLSRVLALAPGHLSLYTLTYESRTPIGRAAARGRIVPADDERVAELYDHACRVLGSAGYEQEEVSNWSKPGHSCRHNWIYWNDRSYVGVGAGAHGYLADPDGPGERYAYSRSDRDFIRQGGRAGALFESGRDLSHWTTEVVGSSLRTCRGVPLGQVLARTGRAWQPTPLMSEALERRIISIYDPDTRLSLTPSEWFRETSWAVEVLRSIR